jgi:uncharacterized phage protein gp47/JayE
MTTLQAQTYTAIVQNTVAAIQGGASKLLDLTVGSVLRAIVEANAAVILWLQGLILQVQTLTRAATSQGSDLDTWVADYGLIRLPAVAATGQVTFTRFTANQQAVVPVGTSVQTADGTQQFTVPADTTNSAWSASLNGFVLATNVSSVTVGVQALNTGVQGNVLAETITAITQPLPGVDTVANASAFTNGVNAETDPALRARFVLYLASLSKATKTAIGSAIANVQQGLEYTITEDFDYNGTYDPGFFYVVIDDGTGFPSTNLQNTVANAIEAVRPITSRYAVFAPIVVTVNVSMTITSASGYVHANVVGAVGTALTNFINSLPLGTELPYTQLAAIAYAVAGVVNVTAVLLDSGTSDVTATAKQVIKAGTVSVA